MNALYIILSGAVSVVSEGDEGGRREVQVGMHYSGETFGEVTLIFPGTVQPTGIRTVGVRTMCPSLSRSSAHATSPPPPHRLAFWLCRPVPPPPP
mmetsp:Transcript_21319/g.67443  ORF Transcript_21319/g.67443 Transcript_21319/m.67443 type:complete len:95 (+) Transcript_21319:641-925(+)